MTDLTPEPDGSGEPLADATPSGAAETGDGPHAEPAEEVAPAPTGEPFDGAAEPGALFDAPEGAAAEPPLRAGLEAILLVVDEPVPEVMLAQILERNGFAVAEHVQYAGHTPLPVRWTPWGLVEAAGARGVDLLGRLSRAKPFMYAWARRLDT